MALKLTKGLLTRSSPTTRTVRTIVQLADIEIKSREVLQWNGLHLFHATGSSCSQKLRIFLNLKNIAWQAHSVDLGGNENYSPWFLGINPRGLVPVLVWDGAVHIESNDILTLLEKSFPELCLIPATSAGDVSRLLKYEDDLHLDLRSLSFRFVFGRTGSSKSAESMMTYRTAGASTVGGVADDEKRGQEIDFYERLATDGITDAAAKASAAKFRAAYEDLERRLADAPYFLGTELSVLDIAWFVYTTRLDLAGYPFAKLHPNVFSWFARLSEQDAFSREVALPDPARRIWRRTRQNQIEFGTTLSEVAGL